MTKLETGCPEEKSAGDTPGGFVRSPTIRTPLAVGCALIGCGLLVVADGIGKALVSEYPVGQIIFFRSAFMLPVAVGISVARGERLTFPRAPWLQLTRGSLTLVTHFCFVAALLYLPLAEAAALSFVAPLFIAALAGPLLKERVSASQWMAITVGLVGVAVMLRPNTANFLNWAVVLVLISALASATKDTLVRSISRVDTSVTTLSCTSLILAAAALLTVFEWRVPTPSALLLLVAGGLVLGSAHYFMIEAFRLAEAATIAPFLPTQLIWSVIIGFAVWGDLPDKWTVIGSLLIVSGGLYIARRGPRIPPTSSAL